GPGEPHPRADGAQEARGVRPLRAGGTLRRGGRRARGLQGGHGVDAAVPRAQGVREARREDGAAVTPPREETPRRLVESAEDGSQTQRLLRALAPPEAPEGARARVWRKVSGAPEQRRR